MEARLGGARCAAESWSNILPMQSAVGSTGALVEMVGRLDRFHHPTIWLAGHVPVLPPPAKRASHGLAGFREPGGLSSSSR